MLEMKYLEDMQNDTEEIASDVLARRGRLILPEEEWVSTKAPLRIVNEDYPDYFEDEKGKNIPQQFFCAAKAAYRGLTNSEIVDAGGHRVANYKVANVTYQKLKKNEYFQRSLLLIREALKTKRQKREFMDGFYNFSEMDEKKLVDTYGYVARMLTDGNIDSKTADVLKKIIDSAAEVKGIKGGKTGTTNNVQNNFIAKYDGMTTEEMQKILEQNALKLLEKLPEDQKYMVRTKLIKDANKKIENAEVVK